MTMMKDVNMNYTLGFVFDEPLERVLLIKKNRGPSNMAGKLNGIGGKVEKDESADEAMERECFEECDLKIPHYQWNHFCRLETDGGTIYCFYTIVKEFTIIQSGFLVRIFHSYKTDEEVGDYWLDSISEEVKRNKGICGSYKDVPHMANLEYLIPMALNHYTKNDNTKLFIVKETY